jgi:hypothetical protein
LFIKYGDCRTGIRFLIGDSLVVVLHNQERQPGDEIFDGSISSFLKLQRRLKELFPTVVRPDGTTRGEELFMRLFEELFHLAERVKRRYRRK